MNILIVDDSEVSCKVIQDLLVQGGHETIEYVTSPTEALNKFQEKQYSLAVIDVVMPNMSGIELMIEINKISRDTKVIIISSLAQESIVLDAIKNGASDFLQKPLNKESFLESVQKVLREIEYP